MLKKKHVSLYSTWHSAKSPSLVLRSKHIQVLLKLYDVQKMNEMASSFKKKNQSKAAIMAHSWLDYVDYSLTAK